MAKSVTLKILIAYEAHEKFTAIIRPGKAVNRSAAPLQSKFNPECGFANSAWPVPPPLSEQAAKSSKITDPKE